MSADWVAAPVIGSPLLISYNGLDAERHALEASDFASSLKGLSRIATLAGTFAVNQRLIERSSVRPVRVMVTAPEKGSVNVWLALAWLDQHQFTGAVVGGLFVSLITYIFKKAAGDKEEMKHLRDALETAIHALGHRDEALVTRLLDTVDRMADVLRPAARQAVAPVGRSAATLQIGGEASGVGGTIIGQAERDAIDAEVPLEVGAETTIRLLFTEMNHDTRTCRVSLEGEEEGRYPAEITDPEIQIPNNDYAAAFAAKTYLEVRAKPTLREGHIERWYISGHT